VTTTPTGTELRAKIAELDWYHTIELPDGTTTRGWVDCRPITGKVLIPDDLSGQRVLDVGTWDGFWAFDLERRGADVVTVDLDDPDRWDWPPHMRNGADDAKRREVVDSTQLGVGFGLLHEAMGSKVEPVKLNVYDLSPETVGMFDLVVVGSILLHLRDPVGALAAIRSVAKGPVVLNEAIELLPTLLSPREPRARLEGTGEVRWWQPNLATVEHMARSAGLAIRKRTRPFFIPLGEAHPLPGRRQQLRSLLSTQGREHVITWNLGIPHVSIYTERDGD
jgi:tRNA (mo5U34)-methyltransferase